MSGAAAASVDAACLHEVMDIIIAPKAKNSIKNLKGFFIINDLVVLNY
jgi:hypothetical protein